MCKNRKAIMTVWDLKGAVKFEYENNTYFGQVINSNGELGISIYKLIDKNKVLFKLQRMEDKDRIEFKIKTSECTLCIIHSIKNLLRLSEVSFKKALINKCIEYLQEPSNISNYDINYSNHVLEI